MIQRISPCSSLQSIEITRCGIEARGNPLLAIDHRFVCEQVINSVLMDGVVVGEHSHIQNSIVCSNSHLHDHCSLRNCQVRTPLKKNSSLVYLVPGLNLVNPHFKIQLLDCDFEF